MHVSVIKEVTRDRDYSSIHSLDRETVSHLSIGTSDGRDNDNFLLITRPLMRTTAAFRYISLRELPNCIRLSERGSCDLLYVKQHAAYRQCSVNVRLLICAVIFAVYSNRPLRSI